MSVATFGTTEAERNVEVFRRVVEEGFGKGNLDRFAQLEQLGFLPQAAGTR